MYARYEQISPTQAQAWLERNDHNRKRKELKISQYARDIANGTWKPSGSTIQLGTAGRLLDGQNRLFACIKAAVPFESWVVYDVPDESFPVIDNGAIRSGADVLGVAGEKDTYYLSAVLNAIIAYERGIITAHVNAGTREGIVTAQDRLETLDRFPSIRESVAFSKPFPSRTPISVLHFLGTRINPERTNTFLDGVRTGVGLEQGNPALLLRDRLLRAASRGIRAGIEGESGYKIAIGIKALDSIIKGERRAQLSWGQGIEKFPVLTGDTLFGSKKGIVVG